MAPGPPSPEREAGLPRRISSATLLLLGSRAASMAAGLVAWGVLARVLAAGDFGRITFYLAVTLVLDALVDLGTSTAALALSAGSPNRLASVLPTVRRMRGVTGTLASLAWIFMVVSFESEPTAGLLLAGLHFPTRALEASGLLFQNEIRWGVPALLRTALPALRLVAVVGLAASGVRSIEGYLLAFAALAAASNVLHHLVARPGLARSEGSSSAAPPSGSLLALAWPLGLASLVQATYFYVDNIFVRRLAGVDEVGLYNAAVKLFSLGALAPALATQVALPWLAARAKEGKLDQAVGSLTSPLLLVGAPAALGLGLLASPLLELAFGPRFDAAAPSLGWLALALLAVSFGAPLLTSLVALARPLTVLRVTGLGLLVNLVGNSALVPQLGAQGAALATLGTEACVGWAAWRALDRLGLRPRLATGPRVVAAVAGALLLALMAHSRVS